MVHDKPVQIKSEWSQRGCKFKNSHFTEMCSGSEAGSYLKRIDSCFTHLKAQGPSGTCDESKEEETAKTRQAQIPVLHVNNPYIFRVSDPVFDVSDFSSCRP